VTHLITMVPPITLSAVSWPLLVAMMGSSLKELEVQLKMLTVSLEVSLLVRLEFLLKVLVAVLAATACQ